MITDLYTDSHTAWPALHNQNEPQAFRFITTKKDAANVHIVNDFIDVWTFNELDLSANKYTQLRFKSATEGREVNTADADVLAMSMAVLTGIAILF